MNKKPKKKQKKIAKNKVKKKTDYEKVINKLEKLLHKKDIREDKYDNLFKKILTNTNKLWLPNKKNKKNVKSHSWFNINEYHNYDTNEEYNINIKVPIIDELVKCQKIKIYPNNIQKKLLLNWLNSYRKMYNETIKLFKKNKSDKNPIKLNWMQLRTNYLKDIKQKIIEESNINIKDKNGNHINTQVNSHILDFAIQDACAKYKTCLSNIKSYNIKHFRLRYLKQSKDTMVMKIEKAFISANVNTFCSSVFKEAFDFQDNFQLKNIHCDFTIHYNQKLDEFYLLNPIKVEQAKSNKNKNSVGIDPGIRTFLTTFANDKCIEIGDNLIQKILRYTTKIDKLNNGKLNKKNKIKKKLERKYYKKINNAIDDLHWKSINYLTNNYGNILIGNMSTKGIINNESNTKLKANIKRVAQHMKLYQFRQRLEYKCQLKSIGYAVIDESYTTMTCTKCGYRNDVRSKHHIKCRFCKLEIDRDFNGARNILLHDCKVDC